MKDSGKDNGKGIRKESRADESPTGGGQGALTGAPQSVWGEPPLPPPKGDKEDKEEAPSTATWGPVGDSGTPFYRKGSGPSGSTGGDGSPGKKADSAPFKCKKMQAKWGIVPGKTWGKLTEEYRQRYLHCVRYGSVGGKGV